MFHVYNLGLSDYKTCLSLQEKLRHERLENKIPNTLILTEHPATYTMGRQDSSSDILNIQQFEKIPLIKITRGGRITYHGPGQLVGYFIVSLASIKMTIPQFVSTIEELLILTLSHWNLKAHRDAEYPGVWLGQEKIAALGLHFDHGVSMHGFSLNINPDLKDYEAIIPCGIRGRGVTSLKKQLQREIEKKEVIEILLEKFSLCFKQDLTEVSIKGAEQNLIEKSLKY